MRGDNERMVDRLLVEELVRTDFLDYMGFVAQRVAMDVGIIADSSRRLAGERTAGAEAGAEIGAAVESLLQFIREEHARNEEFDQVLRRERASIEAASRLP